MTVIKQDDLIQSVADALQFISYYHPVDFIQAMHEAYLKRRVPRRARLHGADPDQLAHVRHRSSADLPGHRHRHRIYPRRHGRALDRRHHER